MTPIRRFLFLAALVFTSTAATCSKTGPVAPPVIADVVGITADCSKIVGIALVEDKVTKVATDLTAFDFKQVEADIRADVGDLVSKGVAIEAAWQDMACIISKLTGEARTDARAAEDQLANNRADNGQRWLDVHRVTFTDAGVKP
jgi:hypothetical protein